jgi:hypothetical protein
MHRQAADFLEGLLCVLGFVRQLLLKFGIRPWCGWLPSRIVQFVHHTLYLLLQLSMIALRGQALLRL